MKKLGLVGGMGPESTIPYYHDIVYGVQEAMGKSIFPELSIESVNVFNVLKLCDEKKYDELTEYLMRAINNLVKSGAEFAALSANTPHIVFDRLKEQSPIPLISIVETTCEEAKHRELKKIGLLGTIFTMTEEFFKAPFVKNGIQVVIPSESELKMINKKNHMPDARGACRAYDWANSFHRLRTPSTACGRSPSLEEGGLGGSPVKASGLAVDCI